MKADPTLKGRADVLGVNYYSDTIIAAHSGLVLGPPLDFSVIRKRTSPRRARRPISTGTSTRKGFGAVLDEAASYGLPIVVTENGVADAHDVIRSRFIAEHLLQIGAREQRGDKVLGYFHWSLLDNFEWANGFCPHFGLHSVNPTTGNRTARASAALYSQIIAAGKLTRDQLDALPAYGAPTPCE